MTRTNAGCSSRAWFAFSSPSNWHLWDWYRTLSNWASYFLRVVAKTEREKTSFAIALLANGVYCSFRTIEIYPLSVPTGYTCTHTKVQRPTSRTVLLLQPNCLAHATCQTSQLSTGIMDRAWHVLCALTARKGTAAHGHGQPVPLNRGPCITVLSSSPDEY
jgi:hypothetical protein